MLILAFDTATDVATSALVAEGIVLGERVSDARLLLADVDELAGGERSAVAAGADPDPRVAGEHAAHPDGLHASGDDLASQRHVFGELLGGQVHADFAGGLEDQIAADNLADQHRTDH